MLLVILGVVVGYPCGANLNIWGGRPPSPLDDLYVLGAFAGIVAFISGCASFLLAAGEAVTSPSGSGPDAATPPRASSRAATPQLLRDGVAKHQAPVPSRAALTRLRVAFLAVVALAVCIVLRDWGHPPLTSSYGRSYWLSAVLTLLLSQLPYGIALIRTWKVPDRAGLALAMAAGTTQVLIAMLTGLRYVADTPDPWPWLSAAFGLATVVLAYLAWRPSFSRKADAGLLISIFFGFIVYTELVHIAVAILSVYMRAR